MIRAITMALMVMVTASAASANEDVQDVHLRVQNLTRPDGKQTATFTGRTAPVATAQPVTVTLQIGATTVTLTGKIGRSGRLRAVGRQLALATPLAAFTRIGVTVSGGLTTALDVLAGECVAAARGRRLDCVEAGASSGALVDGVYDLVIDGHTPAGTSEVARLHTFPDGRRQLTMYDDALNYASLSMTPDLALSGYYWLGGDFGQMVEGDGEDRSTASAARMTGTLTSSTIPDLVFALERDTAGTPSSLGGSWVVTFTGFGFAPWNGTGALTLTVPANGRATTAPTTLTGSRTLTLAASTCDVAPAGGIHCLLWITGPAGSELLQIHGSLDDATGTGQGSFAEGYAPQIRSEGSWTATRDTTPEPLADGAYDLTIEQWTPPGAAWPGSITTNPDGTRAVRLWTGALDYAALTMATDGTLTGYYVLGGDAFTTVTGSAADQSTAALARLAGSYSGSFVGTHAFTLDRPAEGTPAVLGGTWHVTFDGGGFMPFSGTAVLDLTVPTSGLATAAPTTLVRTGGMPAYTTNAGPCTVGPAGGVYCPLPRTVGAGSVYLHGSLDADSGQGTFAIGAAPAIESTGTWTATR